MNNLQTHKCLGVDACNNWVMGKTIAAPGNYVTSWRCQRKLNSFAKFVQEVSTFAARFFAAAAGEPLLVLVLLSLSAFWGLAKAFWVASLIVHPKTQVACLALQV